MTEEPGTIIFHLWFEATHYYLKQFNFHSLWSELYQNAQLSYYGAS